MVLLNYIKVRFRFFELYNQSNTLNSAHLITRDNPKKVYNFYWVSKSNNGSVYGGSLSHTRLLSPILSENIIFLMT